MVWWVEVVLVCVEGQDAHGGGGPDRVKAQRAIQIGCRPYKALRYFKAHGQGEGLIMYIL